MGIHLNWQVESDEGWDEVGESPETVAARRRHHRRLRRVLVALAIAGVILSLVVLIRFRQVTRALRAELEATLAAETLALRLGDQGAFLAIQSPADNWRIYQEPAFQAYQSLGARLEVSGEILNVRLDGSRARVVLRERLDGEPFQVTWFYGHGNAGWRHTAPQADFWGDPARLRTTHFDFTYYDADEPSIQWLSATLNGWWETACRMAVCDAQPPRFEVQVEPDPFLPPGWSRVEPNRLLIPSPRLGRVPEDGSLDPTTVSALSDHFAGWWARNLTDDPFPQGSDSRWMQAELRAHLRHAFDDSAPESSFFAPLVEGYGPDLVPDVLALTQTGRDLLPALAEVTGASVGDLPVHWESYLADRLRREAEMVRATPRTVRVNYGTSAQYTDVERGQQVSDDLIRIPTTFWAQPDTIDVLDIEPLGELVWAEVTFETRPGWRSPSEQRVAYEPFRLVDGYWLHSFALSEDWGPLREERSANIVLRYYALDAPAVRDLLGYLERQRAAVISDLGLARRQPPIYVSVSPFRPGSLFEGGELPEQVVWFVVRSPYVAGRAPDQSPAEYVRSVAETKLRTNLIAYHTGN